MSKNFANFTRTRLNTAPYIPDQATDEFRIFATHQASSAQFVQMCQGWVNARGEALQIESGFVERMIPNALADRVDGIHYIGFNQALLVTLLEFSLFVFTQKNLFPETGDAMSEGSPSADQIYIPGLNLLKLTIAGQTIIPETDKHRVPKDANRHASAVYLALLMTRFVTLHELAHCLQGHVAFGQDKGWVPRLYEVSEPISVVGFASTVDDEGLRINTLQQFEYEADEAALLTSLRIQSAKLEPIDGIRQMNKDTRVRMTLFGIYSMAFLFEEYQDYMNTKTDQSHPKPAKRLDNLVQTVLSQLTAENSEFEHLHNKICDQFNALADVLPNMSKIDCIQLKDDPIFSPLQKEKLSKLLEAERFAQLEGS